MKRKTLTQNLRLFLNRVQHVSLPIEINKVFVHGSYIRGDELPGDLDVIIFYSLKEQWKKWYEAFSSLGECHELIWDCYVKEMTVKDMIFGPLASEIEKRGIPKEWVATYSWSEMFGQTAPYLSYMLNWDRIAKRVLTKDTKGIHIQFESFVDNFKPVLDRLFIYHEMPVLLVWTKDSPTEYILEPHKEVYQKYLELENEKLRGDFLRSQFIERIGTYLVNESLCLIPKSKWAEIALRVLWNTPKYEIDECSLRRLLREFGIPEERVFTIKRRRNKTFYRLAGSPQEEKELQELVRENEVKNRLEAEIEKIVKKVVSKNEITKCYCTIEDIKNGDIYLLIEKPSLIDFNKFARIWENRGFKISRHNSKYAEKSFSINFDEELQKQIKEILGV